MNTGSGSGFGWGKVVVLMGLTLAGVVGVACNAEDGLPAVPGGGTGKDGGSRPLFEAGVVAGPCQTGTSRDCHEELGENGGVVSCFKGVQRCVDGRWSACGEGTGFEVQMASRMRGLSRMRALALSNPVACVSDACNPTCQQFDEVPEGGLTVGYEGGIIADSGGTGDGSTVTTGFDWPGGSSFSYPPQYIDQGLDEPCDAEADCQFNMKCAGPKLGTCTHSVCEAGAALGNVCNDCATRICAANAACCSTSWTATCVALVGSECRVECEGTPPDTDGVCRPWYPTETDADGCPASWDVAVGLTCVESGAGHIPVCNHGAIDAPAGLSLVTIPAGSNQFKANNPSGTTVCATTTDPIPSGECIDVPACSGIVPGMGIMVNPNGGVAGECSTADNWSIYADVPCGPPICSGNSSTASLRPVNIMIVLDKSGSMDEGNPTRWRLVTDALKAFAADPSSAGLKVGLRFFPGTSPDACRDFSSYPTDCSAVACQVPSVAPNALTTDVAPTDTQEQALVGALNANAPGGGTPILPALNGMYSYLQAQQASAPDEVYVVVLVTDGEPTQCTSTDIPVALRNNVTNIRTVASGAYGGGAGIQTYAIGIDGVSVATMQQIADAGQCGTAAACNGQGLAFFASSGSATPLTSQIVNAMQTIAADAVDCTFELPNAGNFDTDPSNASVRYIPGSTVPVVPYCAGDESRFGTSCYKFVSTRERTWVAARDKCVQRGTGWNLVAIDSAAENTFVRSLAVSGTAFSSGEPWIGYTDQTTEGNFDWSNGQCSQPERAGAYTAWNGGQPDDQGACGGGTTNCASQDPSGRWDDKSCSENRTSVCESLPSNRGGRCAAGEISDFAGSRCYFVQTATADRASAQTACAARGAGWGLVSIGTQAENDFVVGAIECGDYWIEGSGPVVAPGYARWAAGEPNGVSGATDCRRVSGDGHWADGDCLAALPYVCEGPSPAGIAPLPSCPSGCTGSLFGTRTCDTTFGGHCYRMLRGFFGLRSWAAAQTYCTSVADRTLVAIDSDTENAFVSTGIEPVLVDKWIGYTRASGSWQWPNATANPSSGAQCTSYTNWVNTGCNGADCSRMTSPTTGTWSDTECAGATSGTDTTFPYVCEGPLGQAQGRCAAGEYEGPDSSCYAYVSAATTHATALGVCQAAKGASWALAALADAAQVNFAAGLVQCGTAWVRSALGVSTAGIHILENGTTAISTAGSRGYLCEGPQAAPSAVAGFPLANVPDGTSCAPAGAGQPDDQWYYNDPVNPTRIDMCPNSCDRVRNDPTGKIGIEIECPSPVTTVVDGGSGPVTGPLPQVTSHTQTYASTCPAGTSVQWNYLRYTASTPGDSRVEFSVRTGADASNFSGPSTLVAATNLDGGTSVCTGACVINVFSQIDPAGRFLPALELTVTLYPGSSNEAPSVSRWQIQYSCSDGR